MFEAASITSSFKALALVDQPDDDATRQQQAAFVRELCDVAAETLTALHPSQMATLLWSCGRCCFTCCSRRSPDVPMHGDGSVCMRSRMAVALLSLAHHSPFGHQRRTLTVQAEPPSRRAAGTAVAAAAAARARAAVQAAHAGGMELGEARRPRRSRVRSIGCHRRGQQQQGS